MITKAMFLLIKIGSTSVTQNRSTNVMQNDPQVLLKIGSIDFTHVSVSMYVYMHVCMYVCMYVCMLCMHVMYVYALLFKAVLQALFKVGSTSVTQN